MCLTLALLAGFAAREPSRPYLTHAVLPSRGPLIEAADHPEWKQFLVQAAFRRADELDRLRALPDTPMIIEPAVIEKLIEPAPAQEVIVEPSAPAATEEKLAALPAQDDAEVKEDITGSIEDMPSGVMQVEIGAASSVELPIVEEEALPPVRQPETLQKLNDVQPKAQPKRVVRAKKKSPAKPAAQPATTGIFPAIFGDRFAVSE